MLPGSEDCAEISGGVVAGLSEGLVLQAMASTRARLSVSWVVAATPV